MDKLFIRSWLFFIGFLVLGTVIGIRATAPREAMKRPLLPASEPIENPMILIPAGFFVMGSEDGGRDERPLRRVSLDAYKISRFEITQSQYATFVAAMGHRRPLSRYVKNREYLSHANQPVVYVSWLDAEAFCKGRGERLPTEAEWEKAAQGNVKTPWPWGNVTKPSYANVLGTDKVAPYTLLVGSFQTDRSSYGLYDVVGNVREWVSDWYDPLYYETGSDHNPQGPKTGEMKVLRGGSWNDSYLAGRITSRLSMLPDYRDTTIGFRCASDVKAPQNGVVGSHLLDNN